MPIFDVEEPTFGLSWTSDESIVFARRRGGLWMVSSNGGDPAMVTGQGTEGPRFSHQLPWVLPDSDVVLYTEVVGNQFEQAKIVAQSLSGGNSKILIEGGTHPIYTVTGHLLYTKLGVLWAVPFDADTLELAGDPVPVVGDIVQSLRTGSNPEDTGAAQISVSASGTLAYLPGALLRTEVRHLAWADRQGNTTRLPFDGGLFWYPRISPDGRRVAVNDQGKILILDLARGVTQRLPGAGSSVGGWSPDGSRVVFGFGLETARNLFWQLADGSEPPERLIESPRNQFGGAVLPDGSALIFVSDANLMRLELEQPGREPTLLLDEAFDEMYPAPSPDGRWLAYAYNESGDWEVYVRAYPGLDSKQQISRDGGSMPAWSPDGRELFYMTPKATDREYAIVAVDSPSHPAFEPAHPASSFADGSCMRINSEPTMCRRTLLDDRG